MCTDFKILDLWKDRGMAWAGTASHTLLAFGGPGEGKLLAGTERGTC